MESVLKSPDCDADVSTTMATRTLVEAVSSLFGTKLRAKSVWSSLAKVTMRWFALSPASERLQVPIKIPAEKSDAASVALPKHAVAILLGNAETH